MQVCCTKIGICSTYFHKNLQYQISRKCVQWEPRWYMRTDGRLYSLITFHSKGVLSWRFNFTSCSNTHSEFLVNSFSDYQLNAQFLYSSTICMLHYDPQHVSSSTLLILRRTNCITTASVIVTLCKQPYRMQVESILYGCLQRVTIPEAVVIQFVLLMISRVLLETCWGS